MRERLTASIPRRKAVAMFSLLLAAAMVAVLPAWGAQVRINVDATKVLRTMQGGIGASWHAIEQPINGPAGSAWGANPPPEDDAAWRAIYRHARWLGLDWCRVEVEQRMYEPERNRFDWDGRDMRVLYRILDYCQQHGVDVFFQQMWANVAWNTFPEWREDPARRVRSGPLSLDDFAAGLARLMQHLIRDKGYTCIRWLSINNEPSYDWSWWQRPPNEPMSITPALAAVRQALDRQGVGLQLSGPDWTDLPAFDAKRIDFDPFIGAYDLHSYYANFDGGTNGYPMTIAEQRLQAWADWAHARHKPFFLSELGTMVFGWRDSDPGPGSYESAIKDAELIIRGLAAGVDAFNRWSLINRGDLDGQWQLIDTWDLRGKKLLNTFTPHPNAYFVFGLVSRFTAKHSAVITCQVEAAEGARHVFAAALRSPKGNLTVLSLNDGSADTEQTLTLHGLKGTRAFYKYQVTTALRDRSDLTINPLEKVDLGTRGFRDVLPGKSLTVYSTFRLKHPDSGIIAD